MSLFKLSNDLVTSSWFPFQNRKVMGPLLVFDFDHTITDLNTDVEVQKLAPGGEIPAR